MDVVTIAEVGILLLGVYYLYFIYTGYYSTIKKSKNFYQKIKTLLRLALLGALALILSFQVYWFTSFYERHKYFEIFLKVVLGIFSLINQMFIYDYEEEQYFMNKKRNDNIPYMNEGKIGFKVINRLFLLYLVYKIFNRNE